MRRFFWFASLILAVLALAMPSALVLASEAIPRIPPVAATVQAAPALPASFKPCQQQGGKRVLPCPTDIGLLRSERESRSVRAQEPLTISQTSFHPAVTGEVDTPPPRI